MNNLISYETVGQPQQEKIEALNLEIEDVKSREDFAKLGLLEANVLDTIPSIEGVKVGTTRNGVEFNHTDSNWSFIDVYVNDSWGRDNKTYDVRYSIGSCSGYSSNDDLAKNIAKMNAIAAVPGVISQMCLILDQWKEVEEAYQEERNALYRKKRQLQEEYDTLISIATKKNEDYILELLAEGLDVRMADGSRRPIYTGYGENREYVGHIKLHKVSMKSITIIDTRVWSDGTVHESEPIRFKKEDIMDDLYAILKMREETSVTDES